MSRPSDYSEETAAVICGLLVEGKSLRKICSEPGMPSATSVFRWLASNPAFREQYARAREEQAETLADEIVDIADDGSNDTYTNEEGETVTNHDVIQRSRLRVEARKWVASKLKPKKYGDKIQQEVSGHLTLENLVTGVATPKQEDAS